MHYHAPLASPSTKTGSGFDIWSAWVIFLVVRTSSQAARGICASRVLMVHVSGPCGLQNNLRWLLFSICFAVTWTSHPRLDIPPQAMDTDQHRYFLCVIASWVWSPQTSIMLRAAQRTKHIACPANRLSKATPCLLKHRSPNASWSCLRILMAHRAANWSSIKDGGNADLLTGEHLQPVNLTARW